MSSSDLAISVRGLGKQYVIAHEEKHTTLAEKCMARLRNPLHRPRTETFEALKDVSFDVKKGEVLGIDPDHLTHAGRRQEHDCREPGGVPGPVGSEDTAARCRPSQAARQGHLQHRRRSWAVQHYHRPGNCGGGYAGRPRREPRRHHLRPHSSEPGRANQQRGVPQAARHVFRAV